MTGGIEEALALAKAAAGTKDVKIGGGVSTVRQYLRSGPRRLDAPRVGARFSSAAERPSSGGARSLRVGVFRRSSRKASDHATHLVIGGGSRLRPPVASSRRALCARWHGTAAVDPRPNAFCSSLLVGQLFRGRGLGLRGLGRDRHEIHLCVHLVYLSLRGRVAPSRARGRGRPSKAGRFRSGPRRTARTCRGTWRRTSRPALAGEAKRARTIVGRKRQRRRLS